MNDLTAIPSALKQVNLSFIRKLIKQKGTVTRAEVAWETNMSSTTVRSLLLTMQRNGEIESIGYDESSGGRKAERYCFKMDKYYGVSFCVTKHKVRALVINICGQILEISELDIKDGDVLTTITAFLDNIAASKDLRSIGLGVPGIVEGGSYWQQNKAGELCKVDLGGPLAERYNLPIVMENDVNAITMGFERCYEKRFPVKGADNMNMAFLFFEQGCVSAGFISGGKLIRGFQNYAGELGLISTESEKTLIDVIGEPMDDIKYIGCVTNILCWICGILNPQYIALGGPDFRGHCTQSIQSELRRRMKNGLVAEVLHCPDEWHDYYEGLANLTAAKMFDEIQLIKEKHD